MILKQETLYQQKHLVSKSSDRSNLVMRAVMSSVKIESYRNES